MKTLGDSVSYISDRMPAKIKVRMARAPAGPVRQANGLTEGGVPPDIEAARRDVPGIEMFDALPVPLWIISAAGEVRFGNRAWIDLTSARDGTAWLEAVHEDDRLRAIAAFQAAAALRTRAEVDLRLRSGETHRWWSLVGAPSYTATGEVDSFFGAAHDTTATRHAQQRLRDLGAKLVAAQEAERRRIARELHDDLAQRVALVASKLGAASDAASRSAALVRQRVAEARNMLHELAAGIHALAHELHPPKLKLLGLAPMLKALCADVAAGSRVPVRFIQGGIPSDIVDDAALCVFRVTQEALQNAIKHSAATRIDVRPGADKSQLTLRVVDDGRGFDPVHAHDTGLGLMTMRERVELVGGRLELVSAPTRGTMVQAIVPLHAAQRRTR